MVYYGISSSSDFFAHYGIKGMKWGVRKAIYNNNTRALERHYRKAARKLGKLERIGNNPRRYAAKAAAYGAAAGLAGGLAISNKTGAAISRLGDLAGTALQSIPGKHGVLSAIRRRGGQLKLDAKNAGDFIDKNRALEIVNKTTKSVPVPGKQASDYILKHPNLSPKEIEKVINADPTSTVKKVTETSRSYQQIPSYGRMASGAAAIGLAGLAAKNAYRATHGAKYRAKANEFRNAMNETFKGTKYEGLNGIPLPKKKRKRR